MHLSPPRGLGVHRAYGVGLLRQTRSNGARRPTRGCAHGPTTHAGGAQARSRDAHMRWEGPKKAAKPRLAHPEQWQLQCAGSRLVFCGRQGQDTKPIAAPGS